MATTETTNERKGDKMIALTSLERFKKDEVDSGDFQVTQICPVGCCRWAIFGRPCDKGVKTGSGARRIFSALTPEVERVFEFSYVPTNHVLRSGRRY